jgi:hypothetical protein
LWQRKSVINQYHLRSLIKQISIALQITFGTIQWMHKSDVAVDDIFIGYPIDGNFQGLGTMGNHSKYYCREMFAYEHSAL